MVLIAPPTTYNRLFQTVAPNLVRETGNQLLAVLQLPTLPDDGVP